MDRRDKLAVLAPVGKRKRRVSILSFTSNMGGQNHTIEREPTEPDEARAHAHEERVMWLEMDDLLPFAGSVLAETGPQHQTPRESAEPGSNVHWARARKVVHAQVVKPAARVPLEVGEDVVDEGGPAEQEQHRGEQAATFQHGTGQDHCRGRHEGEAEARIQNVWDVRVGERGGSKHVVQSREAEVAEHRVRRM